MTHTGPDQGMLQGAADRGSRCQRREQPAIPPEPEPANSDESDCGAGSCDAPAARSGNGGELLGPQSDAGSLRSGFPGSDDGSVSGDDGFCLDGYTPPLTRSPLDPWHSEEYLLKCLVRMHGWYWLEPRVMRGPSLKRRPMPPCVGDRS
jgi:hypothetical protein